MTKKVYQKPTMNVAEAESEDQLLVVSQVNATGLDDDLNLGGSGNMEGDAMSRRYSVWDDNEDW